MAARVTISELEELKVKLRAAIQFNNASRPPHDRLKPLLREFNEVWRRHVRFHFEVLLQEVPNSKELKAELALRETVNFGLGKGASLEEQAHTAISLLIRAVGGHFEFEDLYPAESALTKGA